MQFFIALFTTLSMAMASDEGFRMNCTPMENPQAEPKLITLILDNKGLRAQFQWLNRDWDVNLLILTYLEQMGSERKWVFFLENGAENLLRFTILDSTTMVRHFDQSLDCRLIE